MLPVNSFRLQFITHRTERFDELESAKIALEGGCRWIQLRMKNASLEEIKQVALQLKPLCELYNTVFLLNDHVELCEKIGVDGVHLGKTDMDPLEARKLLGDNFIIGGTCNTFEDIENLKDKPIDYLGLGPFRFTKTKQNLSPILGINGYKNIINQCKTANISIPIVAIGGITAEDVVPILQTGVSGIALSSAVLQAEDPVEKMKKINDEVCKIIR
jgi:thiamine-phosphate pyrophosphorylase